MQELSNKHDSIVKQPYIPSLFDRFLVRRFREILDGFEEGRLDVVWPDGERTRHGDGNESVTVFLHSYDPVRNLILSGQVGFAEAYINEEWSTDSIRKLFGLIMKNEHRISNRISGVMPARAKSVLAHAFNRNTLAGARKNISYHYDLGNDFYALWLDPAMSYSSAIFEQKHCSLEQAQMQKMEKVAQLLGSTPNSRVLEIGCGWGAQASVLASQTGCSVHGISLSTEQLDYARSNNSIEGKTRFEYADYRALKAKYDHIVSIEMFEAVGEAYWDAYFKQLSRLLSSGGTAVLQIITIAENRFERYRRNPDFIQRYIFPGGMLPTKSVLNTLVAKYGFELTDSFDFGDSYSETLKRWRANFEEKLPAIRDMGYDERFIRMWRYYLAYCETGFSSGRTDVGLYQITRL